MRTGWITLQDAYGWAFVQSDKIIGVTGAFRKGSAPESRRLIMDMSNAQVYILNSPENAEALGFAPDDWDTEMPEPPKRKARGRFGRRPAGPTVDPGWKPPTGHRPSSD